MADLLGLVCLATVLMLGAVLMPNLQVSAIAWASIYVVAAASSLFVWHHGYAPTHPVGWLIAAMLSIFLAVVFLAYFRLTSGIFFWQAEPAGSRLFDYIVTLIISPGFTIVAIIGAVRASISRNE